MWDLMVLVPDHCLSFNFTISKSLFYVLHVCKELFYSFVTWKDMGPVVQN